MLQNHQEDTNTTPNDESSCSLTAWCVNKQLFANSSLGYVLFFELSNIHVVSGVFSLGDRKDMAIAELQEQLRDVMFYLETQQQIENLPPEARSEIQEGQINIAANPSDSAVGSAGAGPSSGRGRRGRGRKRK